MLTKGVGRGADAANSYFELRYHQGFALFYKNILLLSRHWVTTLLQVVAVPVLLVIVLVAFQLLTSSVEVENKAITDPSLQDFHPIQRCQIGYDFSYCITIAVVRPPSIATHVDEIIAILRSQNSIVIPNDEIKYFETENELDDFIFYQANITQAGYIFSQNINYNSSQISYTIQANGTISCDAYKNCNAPDVDVVIPYKLAMDRAILSYQRQQGAMHLIPSTATVQTLDVQYIQYPHPLYQGYNVYLFWGGQLFFAVMVFSMVIQAEQVVQEKEAKLRAGMQVMGLKNSVYWFTWFVTHWVMQHLTILMLISCGMVAGFRIFLVNDLITVFVLFSLFGTSMIGMAYIVAAIAKQARVASFVGFGLFLLGFVIYPISVFVIFTDAVEYDWLRWIFGLYSPTVYAKSIADLASASGEGQSGIRWYDIHNNDETWPIQNTFAFLIFDSILYLVIAWYLDAVLPVEYGVSQPWYFPFSPFYWTDHSWRSSKRTTLVEDINEEEEIALKDCMDEDVWNERQRVIRDQASEDTRVKVSNLKKVYRKWPFRSRWDFTAVKGLNLHVKEDSLFCLLGHNGAGKTTTFNMLVGMFAPTEGDCWIDGKSVRRDIAAIRSQLGFCPQHDLLWPVLTAREHLRIYASFKNLPSDQVQGEIQTRLEGVGLASMGDVHCKSFSAGLRRRLSIAISLIGNPSILYLDEPTTGMGPAAMRQVWKVIEESKKGRVTILTTHSMEEAEMLGDNIGIMSKGQFAAMGTASHLRRKFGVGAQLTVKSPLETMETIALSISHIIPDCKRVPSSQESSGIVEYAIPAATSAGLVQAVLQHLEGEKSKERVLGFSIGLSSLEDVFVGIANKAAAQGFDANDAGAKKTSGNDKGKLQEKEKESENESEMDIQLRSIHSGVVTQRLPSASEVEVEEFLAEEVNQL
jgi:ABC-type multidrug transport system ATPase subunit